MTSSEAGAWFITDDDEKFIPYAEWLYYWHPESDSLMRSARALDDPQLEEITEREYLLLQLFMLDEEAFDLIVDTVAEPSLV